MQLTIERAASTDLAPVLALFDASVAWLSTIGQAGQWGITPFSQRPAMVMQIRRYIEQGFTLARDAQGQIIGTLFASTSPPAYIRRTLRANPRPALFVEAFVVARGHAGQGIGGSLLRWAEGEARRASLEWLRLDCYAENPGLVRYYEQAGFERVAPFWVGGWPGMLWERPVPVGAMP